MSEFLKFKTRKDGSTSYRQAGSTTSISFPASAFSGDAPASLQIDGDNLAGPTARVSGARPVDPAIAEARKLLSEARAARSAELKAKLAAMTPEQLAKRDARLAKLKAKAAEKKAAKANG